MWKNYLAVMLGGALGSGLRMWIAAALAVRYGERFPLGTLTVNVTGCLLMGIVAKLTGPGGSLLVSPVTRQFWMIGVLGGYTTFSSFGLQTYQLATTGDAPRAALYVVLSVALCLCGVWLGYALATLLSSR